MSVSVVGGATTLVPLGIEARPPHQEAGDGRSDEATGTRTTESDGSRRVVLARSAEAERGGEDDERSSSRDGESGPGGSELTEDEQRVVREMKARDAEVRAHEMAHVAAGGAHVTSGPTYSYQQGPDGKRYAVGGSVGIDTSAEDDPQATIAKMAQVRAAALAPAQPSGADRAVAAAAAATAAEARAELVEERAAESEEARAERDGVEGVEGVAGVDAPEVSEIAETEPSSTGDGATDRPAAGAEASSTSSSFAGDPQREGGAHRHAGGGACPDCVGARYGAASAGVPTSSFDLAA